jgi:hypothetical protein
MAAFKQRRDLMSKDREILCKVHKITRVLQILKGGLHKGLFFSKIVMRMGLYWTHLLVKGLSLLHTRVSRKKCLHLQLKRAPTPYPPTPSLPKYCREY